MNSSEQTKEAKHDQNEVLLSGHSESGSTENAELLECQIQLKELKERCLRVTADFENFKKREEKNRLHVSRYAQTELITGLLPVIDNFERALKQKKLEEIPQELQAWFAGMLMIDKELQKYFNSINLHEIKDASEFNPELHEAIMTVESPTVPSGNVVEILQKGYRFKDNVIRPAQVSIAA